MWTHDLTGDSVAGQNHCIQLIYDPSTYMIPRSLIGVIDDVHSNIFHHGNKPHPQWNLFGLGWSSKNTFYLRINVQASAKKIHRLRWHLPCQILLGKKWTIKFLDLGPHQDRLTNLHFCSLKSWSFWDCSQKIGAVPIIHQAPNSWDGLSLIFFSEP